MRRSVQERSGASIQSNGNKAVNLHSILPILADLPILAIAPLALPAAATARDRAAYLASVATYKPMAGFNHVVGNKRFVGYFVAAPDLEQTPIKLYHSRRRRSNLCIRQI